MSDQELLRAVAEAADALQAAQERIVELEKLCEQQRKVIRQQKEALRWESYKKMSEHRRSM
jgi:cell fate (sporulation/competence/biofilm development) regulator YmcA (YheA/YmcA/DUF963 family)